MANYSSPLLIPTISAGSKRKNDTSSDFKLAMKYSDVASSSRTETPKIGHRDLDIEKKQDMAQGNHACSEQPSQENGSMTFKSSYTAQNENTKNCQRQQIETKLKQGMTQHKGIYASFDQPSGGNVNMSTYQSSHKAQNYEEPKYLGKHDVHTKEKHNVVTHGHGSQTYFNQKCQDNVLMPFQKNPTWCLLKKTNIIPDTDSLIKLIKTLNPRFKDWNFDLLEKTISSAPRTYRQELFVNILPGLLLSAQNLDTLCEDPIKLLKIGKSDSVELMKDQIFSLLANAFFCNFDFNHNNVNSTYPTFNFITLYKSRFGKYPDPNAQKLKCLFSYFKSVCNGVGGSVKFSRVCLNEKVDWASSTKHMTSICVRPEEARFEKSVSIQVDFANKKIGGGVLGQGCVQEEIRFITCPELIVARLFTEQLQDNEALVIQGVEQYSKYNGYQDTFRWEDDYHDDPVMASKRVLVAIDAIDFSSLDKNSNFARAFVANICKIRGLENDRNFVERNISELAQYSKLAIDRELNKAFAGFKCDGIPSELHISSGNWGGGCFKGDPVLKAQIQHLAAAEAGRTLDYYPFGDHHLKEKISSYVNELNQQPTNTKTVGYCYRDLLNSAKDHIKAYHRGWKYNQRDSWKTPSRY